MPILRKASWAWFCFAYYRKQHHKVSPWSDQNLRNMPVTLTSGQDHKNWCECKKAQSGLLCKVWKSLLKYTDSTKSKGLNYFATLYASKHWFNRSEWHVYIWVTSNKFQMKQLALCSKKTISFRYNFFTCW